MLRHVLREGRPIREGGRLVAVARPREDVVGVLVLVDPAATAGEQEHVALEHGATVLAMELARMRSVAESQMRARRDLVEELLTGTDEESAIGQAQALGYDLERPHRVVVVEGRARSKDDDVFLHAVRRAARDTGVGSLLVARAGAIVVLSDADQPWEPFREAVLSELGGGRCRVGVGGPSERPMDLPRSYRQAQLALKMQDASTRGDQATAFDDLGIYRFLSEVEDVAAIEQFVQRLDRPLARLRLTQAVGAGAHPQSVPRVRLQLRRYGRRAVRRPQHVEISPAAHSRPYGARSRLPRHALQPAAGDEGLADARRPPGVGLGRPGGDPGNQRP